MKLYCVPSFDRESWTRGDLPLEERARRHGHYEWWVLTRLMPFVQADSHSADALVAGLSFGAYHAANFCLKRADLFPLAICMSGVYDVSVVGWRRARRGCLLQQPDGLRREHDTATTSTGCARARRSLLVCGQGQWEDTTGALESTRRFAALLGEKGIRYELDLWGHDVPHDWPSWQRADRAPPAPVRHERPRLIGLLLGTEEDWPAAFEALVARLGPVAGRARCAPSGSSTSRSTCATGRATRS